MLLDTNVGDFAYYIFNIILIKGKYFPQSKR